MSKKNLKKADLSFTKGTVYQDMRTLGDNAYQDIKMSLHMGTSSDIVHYFKDHSNLLKNFRGDEKVKKLFRGTFSEVYLLYDNNGYEVVVKRSHDGWVPCQAGRDSYVYLPRWCIDFVMKMHDIEPESLRRDVYDYEEIIKPHWGKSRTPLTDEKFQKFINMGLYMVYSFLPAFNTKDLYSEDFWNDLLNRKPHKRMSKINKYLGKTDPQEKLIPSEERFILYDKQTDSLQTIFLQKAMRGQKEIIPGKRMAFPFELVEAGNIPQAMPLVMIEHILRTIESFVTQLKSQKKNPKVTDFRPLEAWKVYPPTPIELYFGETSNLVAYSDKNSRLNISLVDTHLLLEPEGNMIYRWIEKRYWRSLFVNLRFWMRKALDYA